MINQLDKFFKLFNINKIVNTVHDEMLETQITLTCSENMFPELDPKEHAEFYKKFNSNL